MLSPDGREPVWDDFYYSDDVDGEIKVFHNHTGKVTKDASEMMSLSIADLHELSSRGRREIKALPWRPMYEYGKSSVRMEYLSLSVPTRVRFCSDEPVHNAEIFTYEMALDAPLEDLYPIIESKKKSERLMQTIPLKWN
jgi:hypothetical protein